MSLEVITTEPSISSRRRKAGVSTFALMAAGGVALGLLATAGTASAQASCGGEPHYTGGAPDSPFGGDLDYLQTACGGWSDTRGGTDNTAIGAYAKAGDGNRHTAIGSHANAEGETRPYSEAGGDITSDGNTALGFQANASGSYSANLAMGVGSWATGSRSYNIALGNNAQAVGDESARIAIGQDTNAVGANSVAMGWNAEAQANYSVAIGSGSVANEEQTFAVGNATFTRRIVNVTAGNVVANGSDAVNGGQLFSTNQRVTRLEAVVADGVTRGEVYAADAAVLNSAMSYTDSRETEIRTDMAAGDAATLVAATTYTDDRESVIRTDMAAGDAATLAAAAARDGSIGASVASALGGGATYDSVNALVTAPNYGVAGAFYNNVGGALNAIDTTGTRHFRTDGALGMAQATGVGSTAMGGQATASGERSTAAGASATASGVSAVAVGDTAQATADGAVAVGLNSTASGVNAIAIGAGATATGSVAVGAGASAANGGAAFGDGAVATGENAMASGPGAQALAASSAAIGSGSVANQANTVSVGAEGATRRITNVAAGTAPTDAANVGQLGASGASVARALGGGATADASGVISAPRYALGMGTFDNVGSALDAVSSFASDSRREARRGIAAAMAMSSAPMPSAPGRTSWTVNAAEFNGEAALGGSIAHRFGSGERPLAVSAGFSHSGGESGFRVGMSGEF